MMKPPSSSGGGSAEPGSASDPSQPPGSPSAESPPPGPPWDLSVNEVPFAFVDLEMTSLDLASGRVIEICVSRIRGVDLGPGGVALVGPEACGAPPSADGRVEDSLETLINPGPLVTWEDGVHGLTRASLEHAPRFEEIAARVEAILQGAIPVAHAASWDIRFIEAELRRLGREVRFPFYLDTLTLARRAFRADSYSLQALARKFGIAERVLHRAGDDVRILRALFQRVCAELAPSSARDLWHVRVAERHARPEIVEACLAHAESGEPAWITYRPSHKAARSFQAIVRQVRTDLDPPRVLGYSLPGRGRFDLRTDRILSIGTGPTEGSPPRTP